MYIYVYICTYMYIFDLCRDYEGYIGIIWDYSDYMGHIGSVWEHIGFM